MRKTILIAAAAVSMLGAPALAQETVTTADTGMSADPTVMPVERDDDNDFPWGLLGLLGLAGLLGRKRDTHVHHDTTVRRDV